MSSTISGSTETPAWRRGSTQLDISRSARRCQLFGSVSGTHSRNGSNAQTAVTWASSIGAMATHQANAAALLGDPSTPTTIVLGRALAAALGTIASGRVV